MKKILLFFALAAMSAFSSCGDQGAVDDSGVDFPITFKAVFGSQAFEKSKEYTFGSIPLFFESNRMYLSDITLLNGSKEIVLSEIEYLDFTPSNASSASPVITYKNVPEGAYTGIRIGYGVKPELNAQTPANFPAGHPLSFETDYWSGWKSYIFSVLDGKADPDLDGVKNLSLAYHCGSNAVYKTIEFNQPIHVHSGEPGLSITFDFKEFLTLSDGSLYDIVAHPATSNSASDVSVAQVLTANFERATKIEQ